MTAAKLLPFLLASGGLASLHFLLKVVPAGANSGATLAVAYVVASLACLAAFPVLTPGTSFRLGLGTVPWHALAMGVAVLAGVVAVALGLDTGMLAQLSPGGSAAALEKSLFQWFGPRSGDHASATATARGATDNPGAFVKVQAPP